MFTLVVPFWTLALTIDDDVDVVKVLSVEDVLL